MTTTFGTFNYRAAKGQQSDPVRAQGDSIVKLVSLFKKHLQSPGESGTDQTTSNASSSFDIVSRSEKKKKSREGSGTHSLYKGTAYALND